jgi:hypothetical protein
MLYLAHTLGNSLLVITAFIGVIFIMISSYIMYKQKLIKKLKPIAATLSLFLVFNLMVVKNNSLSYNLDLNITNTTQVQEENATNKINLIKFALEKLIDFIKE